VCVHGFFNIDISQGSVATYIRCDGILNCKFTTESVSERTLKIG